MATEAIDHLTDEQIEDLQAMYRSEWWTLRRELPDIRFMLEHTDLIVAFCDSETKRLVAFARVLTDYIYKALIFDVIVDGAYREKGLGKALMESIVNHPSLRSVRHLELYCRPELVRFYEKWGFTKELGELHFMRLTR